VPETAPAAFISYCREDSEFALRLAQDLRAAGADVWIDQLAIPAGRPWDTAIQDALAVAPIMVVILSPHSAGSNNVLNEISFALEQGMTVIPAIYRDCVVPLQIHRANRIDFRADYAHGLASLLASLKVANPNPEVLHDAAAAEAQRKTAWQAREAEARRLQDLADSNRKSHVALPAVPIPAPSSRRGLWIVGAIVLVIVPVSILVLAHVMASPPSSTPAPAVPAASTKADAPKAVPEAVPAAPKPSTGKAASVAPPLPSSHAPSPAIAARAKEAEDLYDRKQYEQALPGLTQACTAGVAADCARLGHMYEVKLGVTQDFATAKDLYTKACNAGNAEGCGRLGFLYYHADGVAEDDKKARELYTKGCNGNYIHACFNLGKLYDDGTGVPVDYGHAAQLYKKACDGGDGNGCGELGYLYVTGLGVPQDWDRAKPLLQKGCSMGSQVGCVQLDNINRAAASKSQNP
jgi:TPR repeat protein